MKFTNQRIKTIWIIQRKFDKMSNKEKYCGVIVPMLTPLTKELEIDRKGVENIVNGFLNNYRGVLWRGS